MLEITFVSQVSVEKKQILWFIFEQENRKKIQINHKRSELEPTNSISSHEKIQ